MDGCKELLTLNIRDCVDASVTKCVKEIESLGEEQYQQIHREVIYSTVRSIHIPVTKNSESFQYKRAKPTTKAKHLADLCNNFALPAHL